MQLLSVFGIGYTFGDFEDFGNWKAQINNSKPIKLTQATISCSPTGGGYFTYLIHARNFIWMLEYTLIDTGLQDFIRWLESIYLECSESFLIMNQEGPEELVRAYQEFSSNEIRLTMISNAKRIYVPEKHRYFYDIEFTKKIDHSREKQVVFDIIVNKLDFVEAMYILTQNMATKENEPTFKSEVIESFIKELPEEHENMLFQKDTK